MTYTKIVDYAAKDLLLHGDPAKAVKGTEIGAEFDAIAAADALNLKASTIHASTNKGTPIDADEICALDSTTSFSLIRITWANLKTTLGGIFATLAGSASQVFSVGTATSAAHATRKDQVVTSYASITITRDLTVASGNVAYTGLGGRPKLLRFYNGHSATNASSIGESNAVFNVCKSIDYANNVGTLNTACIAAYQGAGANQLAVCAALDADGFTLTWTKTGSPTGTSTIRVVAEL